MGETRQWRRDPATVDEGDNQLIIAECDVCCVSNGLTD